MVQKKVIIIGATSGIGYHLACKYVEDSWKVGITGRRENLIGELISKYPGKITGSAFDVTESDNRSKVESLVRELGGLDLLIYNAGYGEPSRTVDWNIERKTTLTNVLAFVDIVSFAFDYFVKQGYGHIALTSSVAGLRGNSWTPAYSASKAFMSNYAEGLSIKAERIKKKIFITDIRPGFVDTKMAKGNRQFWVVPVEKAATQIINAISKNKRVAYISPRWLIIAALMKNMPYMWYRKIG
ncbi:MAG: SDR family NAD(P)-dependent oxidoreductase [Flavisolibacter sp.]